MSLTRSAASPRAVVAFVVLAFTSLVAYQVCRIPVQVSDSLGNMLQVQPQPLSDVFISQFSNGAYIRPLLWAQIKLAYESAGGRERLMFKTIHVAQLVLLALLMLRLMRVDTWADAAAAILATLVLFGLHTFDGLVREAFPINSFLTIALAVLAALNLSMGEPRWWRDAAAAALFLFSILTIESGVLVVAALAAARAAGLKGVTWKGLGATGLALAAYLVLRFAVLDAGSSGAERARLGLRFPDAGARGAHGAVRIQSAALLRLQRHRLAGVGAAGRAARRRVVRGTGRGRRPDVAVVAADQRRRIGARHRPGAVGRGRRAAALACGAAAPRDRLLLASLAVLGANAVVSFAYTKDVIMSAGGACFALAVYAAASTALQARGRTWPRAARAAVAIALALWTVRAAALPIRLEMQAARVRQEWQDVEGWLARQHIAAATPEARALVTRLRRSALRTRPHSIEWSGWRSILDLN